MKVLEPSKPDHSINYSPFSINPLIFLRKDCLFGFDCSHAQQFRSFYTFCSVKDLFQKKIYPYERIKSILFRTKQKNDWTPYNIFYRLSYFFCCRQGNTVLEHSTWKCEPVLDQTCSHLLEAFFAVHQLLNSWIFNEASIDCQVPNFKGKQN